MSSWRGESQRFESVNVHQIKAHITTMCAFYLSDVSRGREPNHRLAFGKRLRFLALCSVFILADSLCRLVVNLRNRGPRGILCTRGEKAHTSKRVSIVACENAISKVQCAPRIILNRFLLMPTDNNNFSLFFALSAQNNALTRCFVCCGAVCIFWIFTKSGATLWRWHRKV